MPKFQKIVLLTALVILTNLASVSVAFAKSDLLEFDINQKFNSLFKNSIESAFSVEKISTIKPEKENSSNYQTELMLVKDPIKPIDVPIVKKLTFNKVQSNYQIELIQNKKYLAHKIQRTASLTPDPGHEQKRYLVQNIANQYEIDWKILEAIWQVESGKSWDRLVTSSDGAQGPMQFLPSTFRKYARDGDGDGSATIENSADALASAANLLQQNSSLGDIDNGIFSYNHSISYVNRVKSIANSI